MKNLFSKIIVSCALVAMAAGAASADYTNTTIYNIQQNLHALTDSVRVTSVVVVGVDVRPSTFGVYIQEQAGGAYSGVLAYRSGVLPAYEAPNGAQPVALGDRLTVEGIVGDFGGLSEILNPILTFESTGTPLAPEVLPVDSLTTGYAGSERWETVLVQVQNIVITSTNAFNNWYFHNSTGSDSLSGIEKMISGQVVPQVGDTLLSATGVLEFAQNERRLAPRGNDDIIFLSQGPAPAPNLGYASAENKIKVRFNVPMDPTTTETVTNYSLSNFDDIVSASYDNPSQTVTLTTTLNMVPSTTPLIVSMSNLRNAEDRLMEGTQTVSFIEGISTIPFIQDPISAANDTSKVNNQQVTFRGVVTAVGNGVEFPGGLGFFVQDRSATEYAGLFVFGSPVTPAHGDSLLVSGFVTEFGVGPETEITGVDEVVIYGSTTNIAPIDVTVAQINGSNLAEAEKFESTLVRVSGVTVLTSGYPGWSFDVQQTLAAKGEQTQAATEIMRVDDLAMDDLGYQPLYEDVLDVTGIIRFSGSAPFRRLQPRNWNEPPTGDIHVVTKSAVSDVPPGGWRTQLAQNSPNPFNPQTRIAFTIGVAGRASVEVYDLRGRLVRTLLRAEVEVGPQEVIWNGLDNQGRRVSSGIYFYRLESMDAVETRKMVVLK